MRVKALPHKIKNPTVVYRRKPLKTMKKVMMKRSTAFNKEVNKMGPPKVPFRPTPPESMPDLTPPLPPPRYPATPHVTIRKSIDNKDGGIEFKTISDELKRIRPENPTFGHPPEFK